MNSNNKYPVSSTGIRLCTATKMAWAFQTNHSSCRDQMVAYAISLKDEGDQDLREHLGVEKSFKLPGHFDTSYAYFDSVYSPDYYVSLAQVVPVLKAGESMEQYPVINTVNTSFQGRDYMIHTRGVTDEERAALKEALATKEAYLCGSHCEDLESFQHRWHCMGWIDKGRSGRFALQCYYVNK